MTLETGIANKHVRSFGNCLLMKKTGSFLRERIRKQPSLDETQEKS